MRLIKSEIVLSVLIFAISLLTFSCVLTADFVQWDDDIIIYNNSKLTDFSFESVKLAFTDVHSMMRYNPLTLLGWSFTHDIWGFEPFWFHLGNWLLHAFSSILVFWIIRKMLLLKMGDRKEIALLWINVSAAIATLIWAIHPLRAEPVSWATDRTYCQSTFFLLVSLLFYLWANDSSIRSAGKRFYLSISFFCYTASLLSYAISMTFFLVLIVIDVYLLKRLGGVNGWIRTVSARKVLIEKLPFFASAMFIAIITVSVRLASAGVWSKPVSLSEFGLIDRFMQAMYTLAYYIWKPWYPVKLAPVYTTLVSFDPLSFPFIGSAMLISGLVVVLILIRRRCSLGLALLICHIVLLVPVLGLFEHPHYHCDRYSYVVSMCWSVLFAFLLVKIKTRNIFFSLTLILIIPVVSLLGFLSFQQARIWNNSITLFEHMITNLGNDPYRHDIHWRLGMFHRKKGNMIEAFDNFKKTLEIVPNHSKAHIIISQICFEKGSIDDAIVHLKKAISNSRNIVVPANNLAWYLATYKDSKYHNPEEAIRYAEMACELTNYKDPQILYTLAASYASAGEFLKAVETGEDALKLALSSNQKDLAERILSILNLYKSGRPYIEHQITIPSKGRGKNNHPN